MINKEELIYKLKIVIKYLKNNSGFNYELYNRLCSSIEEPDSNIVKYTADILYIINYLN